MPFFGSALAVSYRTHSVGNDIFVGIACFFPFSLLLHSYGVYYIRRTALRPRRGDHHYES